MKKFNPDRRKFLKLGTAVVGTSLVIGVSWSSYQYLNDSEGDKTGFFSPNAWLRLETNGLVTVIVAEAEMGQGIFTSIPMLVAEELEIEWSRVSVEHASLDPIYGYQSTGGSNSIRKGWSIFREAGAIARELLITAGALELDVPASECKAIQGKIIHARTNREIPYEKLIETASTLSIPDKAYLKEPNEFTVIGQSVSKLDMADKTNGKARYGIDTKLPDMLYATITQCPVFGGKPKHVDASDAKKIRGVQDVLQIDKSVVVVASDTWSAIKAKKLLKIDWDNADNRNISTDTIVNSLREQDQKNAKTIWKSGDIAAEFSKQKSLVEAEYLQPFQAHVTMEPMNCTAHFKPDDKLEIWAPTQSPSSAYDVAQTLTQSKIERGLRKVHKKLVGTRDPSIDVHTTLMGGGFGRRLKQDYVEEVIKVAQHYKKPVQLVWTREEDIQQDYYHPLSLHKMKGALDSTGLPVAWEHYITGNRVSRGGAEHLPYEIANAHVVIQRHKEIIPKGSWRSVSPHYNTFAIEHFFDELAWAGNNDPLEMRLKLLKNKSRLQSVLEMAATMSNWSSKAKRGNAIGTAVISEWGTHMAQVVELEEFEQKKFKVRKVTCVVDCGIAINPDIIKQQIEGSVIFGLTAATKSKITIKEGRVEQSNYHNYPILRLNETPEIEVFIIKSDKKPGGIGEPGVPPLAPALANAMMMATGKPVRELPIKLA